MKAYKVFDSDWSCRGFSYKKDGTIIGTRHIHEGRIELCGSGFHFCRKLSQCFNYYSFNPSNRVAEIEVFGKVIGNPDDKECTDGFEILRELSWHEVLALVNTGVANTGDQNSGDQNSGHRNSGDQNSGDQNSGDLNSGDLNSGNRNSGDQNSGHRNSGHRNSGNRNSGNRNSGNWNSGNWNSGNWNSGDRNSGDLNSTSPNKFRIFNVWVDESIYEKIVWPDFFYFDLTIWISFDTASEEERKQNKTAIETCGGFLKSVSYKKAFIASWNKASKEDKLKLFEIPGFDQEIFLEISGIDAVKEDVEKT